MAFWDSVKNVLGAVAPVLGTALGGPLGGTAAAAIADALGLGESATDDEIKQIITRATPDQMMALKKADQEFAVHMRELDIDLERISQSDRDSARKREIEVKDRMPMILGIGVTIGFFGVLGYMLGWGLPHEGGEALLVMLGSLGTAWSGIIAYYFGSSVGSRLKDLTSLQNAKNGA